MKCVLLTLRTGRNYMPKKKPYFHNNWEAFKNQPAEFFLSIPFDEFMDWKIAGWELPSSCNYLIRERSLKTGKVKEYAYQKPAAARKKLEERMESGEFEFTVCNHDAVHFLTPNLEDPYDDPLA